MLTILGFFGKGMKILLSFIGVDKTTAQAQIVSEGFTVGTVTQSDSADAAQLSNHNKVISQTPAAATLIDYETPVNITWRNFSFSPYSFTPTAYSFTPFSFTPTTFSFTPQYSFTPYAFTPYAFTPYAFTPYAFTPVAPITAWYASGCCGGTAIYGSSVASSAQALDNLDFQCVNSPTQRSVQYGTSYPVVDCTAPYSFTPYAFTPYAFTPYAFTPYAFTPYAFTPVAPATTQYWAYCANTNAGYTLGTVLTGSGTESCASAYQQLVSFGEISGGWVCQTGSAPTPPTPQFCGAPAYSFTPYAFTPYAFTPMAYSFTPFSFTPTTFTFTPMYTFTPYAFTPYAFTPYAFTPMTYSFTPNSLCSDFSVLTQSQCQTCGGSWDPVYGECTPPGS